ncbi:hypothetical protein LEP1GSC029_4615, partial [Leptospira interrogans str. 2002000626]
RNPWRYSFDPKGRLIVADVGQDLWEEVSIVERGKIMDGILKKLHIVLNQKGIANKKV